MGRRRAPELYRAPFPLYALQVDPSTGLLIAAGGGGAAKTGIKNGVVKAQGHPAGSYHGPRAIRAGSGDGPHPSFRSCPYPVEIPGKPGIPTRVSAENLITGL